MKVLWFNYGVFERGLSLVCEGSLWGFIRGWLVLLKVERPNEKRRCVQV